MSVPGDRERDGLRSAREEGGWLIDGERALFAFHHPAASVAGRPARSHAVLIWEPLGCDRMLLHAAHRRLAERLAAAGFPTLRFDPTGMGDASDSPRSPGWTAARWCEDAAAAAAWLRAESGAHRLAVHGTRLGATLALRLEAAETAMLWGPFLDGRAFLRAERALGRLLDANRVGRRPARAEPGERELMGFVYPRETLASIEALSAGEPPSKSLRRVHLVGWDATSPEASLAHHLAEAGVDVAFASGHATLAEDVVSRQVLPEALIDRWVDWLVTVDEAARVGHEGPTAPEVVSDSARAGSRPAGLAFVSRAVVDRGPPSPARVEEATVWLAPDRGIFGVSTTPVGGEEAPPLSKGGPGLVLVNGGHNHRVGINRNYTEWAREAAAAGTPALRFDVRGLGDSPALDPADRAVLYREATRADVLEAVDWMAGRTPAGVVLAGLCAGGYQALGAACDDARVRGLVLLDLLRWELDAPTRGQRGFWSRRRSDWARWRTRLPGPLGRPPSRLARALRALTGRGTRVLMISCEQGGAAEEVERALGAERPTLEATGCFALEVLSDTDHLFSPLWAQEYVASRLADFLSDLRDGPGARLPGDPGPC